MSNKTITLATAQSFVSDSVQENGKEIRKLMLKAHHEGAHLIHFAEGAMSGYVKSQIKDWQDVNWQDLKLELELICQLASELSLWVVLGCNHALSAPNRPHNSLYIISAHGDLHTRYDKQFLSHTELTDWYTPGKDLCVFDLNGWRFGCTLCIEIQFPELFIAYREQAIDCMLFSAYSDSPMFGVQARAYAASHNYWLSFSVPTQMSQLRSSHMISPDGEVQTACEANRLTLSISLLDRNSPNWKIPLDYAKPWRAKAREGNIYRSLFVEDVRSNNKTRF